MIPGAYEAAVMRKMRELRYSVKYDLTKINYACQQFSHIYLNGTPEQRQNYLIELAAMIGNHLEDV